MFELKPMQFPDEPRRLCFLEKREFAFPWQKSGGRSRYSVIRIAREHWGEGFLVYNTRFHGFTLMLCMSGSGFFESRAGRESLRAGSLVIYPPDEPRVMGCAHGETMRLLILQFHAFERATELERMCGPFPMVLYSIHTEPLELQLQAILELTQHLPATSPYLALDLLPGILGIVRALKRRAGWEQQSRSRSLELFQQAKGLVDSQCETLDNVHQIATELGISHAYLCRLFQTALDTTPTEYLMRMKMNRACHRLRQGESIDLIAEAFGFADRFSFSKAFKRVIGLPPGQFRDRE